MENPVVQILVFSGVIASGILGMRFFPEIVDFWKKIRKWMRSLL